MPGRCASISGRRPGPHRRPRAAAPREEPQVSIIRVGLSEAGQFGEGYDAIFGRKKKAAAKKLADKKPAAKAAAKKKPTAKPKKK